MVAEQVVEDMKKEILTLDNKLKKIKSLEWCKCGLHGADYEELVRIIDK